MGGLFSACCGSTEESEQLTPDPELRRRQMAEAAEKRATESENRGIKNPERVKRLQKKAAELDKLERESGYQQANLKIGWIVSGLYFVFQGHLPLQ